jgi:hypothetical protein
LAPVTVNRTVALGTGFPNRSVTVAVTQCSSPTGFSSATGVRVTVAGAAATQILVTGAATGSPAFGALLLFWSAYAVIVSTPALVPV